MKLEETTAIYLVNGKEVTKKEYDKEFAFQNVVYGSVASRSGYNKDKGQFVMEIIDFSRLYGDQVSIDKTPTKA